MAPEVLPNQYRGTINVQHFMATIFTTNTAKSVNGSHNSQTYAGNRMPLNKCISSKKIVSNLTSPTVYQNVMFHFAFKFENEGYTVCHNFSCLLPEVQ
jgi:hypothetical protein